MKSFRTFNQHLYETAAPGQEKFIKDAKEDFKKRYGKDWQRVLYATAWKRHDEDLKECADILNDILEDFVVSEEFEQLDELSKQTLGSYLSKSVERYGLAKDKQGQLYNKGEDFSDYGLKVMRYAGKRKQGIDRAIKKLSESEDFQQLDELSKNTLYSYTQQANQDKNLRFRSAERAERSAYMRNQYGDKDGARVLRKRGFEAREVAGKRERGIKKAIKRLQDLENATHKISEMLEMDENFQQLDELSKKTLVSYIKKAADDGMQRAYEAGGGTGHDRKGKDTAFNHAKKRLIGVQRAADRISEKQLDEIHVSDEWLKAHGMTRAQYNQHEYGRTPEPKLKVGSKVDIQQGPHGHGTVHDIYSRKIATGATKKFMHVKHDNGKEEHYRIDTTKHKVLKESTNFYHSTNTMTEEAHIEFKRMGVEYRVTRDGSKVEVKDKFGWHRTYALNILELARHVLQQHVSPVHEETEQLDEVMKTKNESYGFHGTIEGTTEEKDHHWKKIFPHAKKALEHGLSKHQEMDKMVNATTSSAQKRAKMKVTDSTARNFLDSTHGRHIADAINDGEKHHENPGAMGARAHSFMRDYNDKDFR